MFKNMLGRPRDVDLFGLVYDFMSKLRSGAITPEDAKKFLRKEKVQTPHSVSEGTFLQETFTGEEVDEFMKLVDAVQALPKPSERVVLIVDYMLRKGINSQTLMHQYKTVCPNFRRSSRFESVVIDHVDKMFEFVGYGSTLSPRMQFYSQVYDAARAGKVFDPVPLIKKYAVSLTHVYAD